MLITIKQFCLKEGIQNGLWVGVEAWKIKEKKFFFLPLAKAGQYLFAFGCFIL